MHAAQKKQSVHHLKKNNNEKGFAVANSFFSRNLVDGREG